MIAELKVIAATTVQRIASPEDYARMRATKDALLGLREEFLRFDAVEHLRNLANVLVRVRAELVAYEDTDPNKIVNDLLAQRASARKSRLRAKVRS